MKILVNRSEQSRRSMLPPDSKLGFGRHFTDHMFKLDYLPTQGWHNPRIVPYAPLALSPACMVLHYAQQVFEGMKAYLGDDRKIRVFRCKDHMKRLQRSAARVCIPAFDEDLVATGLQKLVAIDHAWIPKTEGCALYLRPNIVATDAFLGVRPSASFLLYVIATPVGPYFREELQPVDIMVTDKYVRAAPGGTGECKTGGNYAASLLAQVEASELGYDQVLWLDAVERRYVEEVGAMNIFFVFEEDGRPQVVTSPLSGSVLAGVTRSTVLQLLTDWDIPVTERRIDIDQVLQAADDGTLSEVFGTGTAAIVAPVGSLRYREVTHTINGGQAGTVANRLYKHITALHYGRAEDAHGWTECVEPSCHGQS